MRSEAADYLTHVPKGVGITTDNALLLPAHGRPLAVAGDDGRVIGLVTLSHLEQLIAEEADGDARQELRAGAGSAAP